MYSKFDLKSNKYNLRLYKIINIIVDNCAII